MSEADERHRQSTASRAASRQRDAALDAAMAHHPAGKQITREVSMVDDFRPGFSITLSEQLATPIRVALLKALLESRAADDSDVVRVQFRAKVGVAAFAWTASAVLEHDDLRMHMGDERLVDLHRIERLTLPEGVGRYVCLHDYHGPHATVVECEALLHVEEPCKTCGVRRDEHADQPYSSPFPGLEITEHRFTESPGVLIPAEHFPTLAALIEHAESWRNEWNEYIRPSAVQHGTYTKDELAERDKEFDEVAGLITYIRGQQD